MTNLHAIIGYPLFIVAGLELLLGFLLVMQNPKNSPVNRSVALLAFFSAAFSLCTGLMYVSASLGLGFTFYARANWIGWFTLPAALQFLYYSESQDSRTAYRIGLILYPFWSLMLALSIFTDLIVTGNYVLIPFSSQPGPLDNLLRFFGACLAVWVIVKAFLLRRSASGLIKKELSFFFFGVFVFGSGAGFTAGVLQLFGGFGLEPGLASYFSLPWVALTVYAIARYQLFDIRLILSRTIATILLLIIFSSLQAGLFLLFEQALGSVFSVFASLAIIGFLFFGTPFSGKVQSLVNSLVLKDKYLYQDIISNATRAMSAILNLDDLLAHIMNTLRESLRVESASLYLRTAAGGLALRKGFGGEAGAAPSSELSGSVVQHLLATRLPVIHLVQKSLPEESAVTLAKALKAIGAEVLVPIFYQGRLQGALSLGLKLNRSAYNQTDILLLETLAGHAAAAIENATLFQETLRIQESLRESEGKFRTLAETIPAAIFIHQGGKFLYANPAAELLTGYGPDELLNMEFWEIVHPEYRHLIRDRAGKRLTGEQLTSQYEFKIIARSGEEKWVIMSAGAMDYQGRPAIIGTVFEVTERKNLESRLHYMQKMEAIGKLAGGVAHDFNNILGVIVGHASFLQLGIPQEDPLQANVNQILSSTERAATLTQQLLTYGTRKGSALHPCDLASLVGHQAKFLTGVLPATVRLVIASDVYAVPVMADGPQIERILMNLIVNARDAMPSGGTIEVKTGIVDIDTDFTKKHDFGKPGTYAFLSVNDTGAGMDESVRKRIFEPFFSTKGSGKGTGFGLSIVYDIVKDHNGYIAVASTPGQGSLFTVYLPLTEAAAVPRLSAHAAAPASGGKTILLAEDDETARAYVKTVLEDQGYTVIEAEDGEVAVKKYRDGHAGIHLVVTDMIMPKMNGREVFNLVRSITPGAKVLFTSGYSEELLMKTGILAAGQPFLPKPATRADIIAKTQQVLAQ
ncbi:MAG: PAS domain S-box protein [Nitrospirota bacterium]